MTKTAIWISMLRSIGGAWRTALGLYGEERAREKRSRLHVHVGTLLIVVDQDGRPLRVEIFGDPYVVVEIRTELVKVGSQAVEMKGIFCPPDCSVLLWASEVGTDGQRIAVARTVDEIKERRHRRHSHHKLARR